MNPAPFCRLRATACGWTLALLVGLAVAPTVAGSPPAGPPCPPHGGADTPWRIEFLALAADLWWVPAQPGEADAGNRGQVLNLVLARHQGRLWLLGSGPSPAFAQALRCAARQKLGLEIGDVANPYARAELVLGNAGLPGARVSAPAPVLQAMRAQCPTCVGRLRARLGAAAIDLGEAPVRLPQPLPARAGEGGWQRWGPFEWRLVQRAEGAWTSLWRHRGAAVTAGFGVLWFDGPPDGRDTEPRHLVVALAGLAASARPGERFVGDAGPPGDREAVRQQLDYWRALWSTAERRVAAGDMEPGEPPEAAGPWNEHARHRLNWQRAWRLAEDALLAPPTR